MSVSEGSKPTPTPVIAHNADNDHLNKIEGIGPHQPIWEPCGDFPAELGCKACLVPWPCGPIGDVIDELEAIANGLCCGSVLWRRAEQLRGLVGGSDD